MSPAWRKPLSLLIATLLVAAAVLHLQGRSAFPATPRGQAERGHFVSADFGGLSPLSGKPGERQHDRDRWEPKPLAPRPGDHAQTKTPRRALGDRETQRRSHASAVRRSRICRWQI